MSKKVFLFCCVTCIALSAFAQIYRHVEPDGTIVYSDQPNPKSEVVSLPAVNYTPPPSTQITQTTDATNATKKKAPYTQFKIASPQDQQTFQNATEITVSVSINPSLQLDDKIQYLLDGAPVSEPITSTSYTIPKISGTKEIISRGTHTISAQLIDDQGNVLKTTPSVTIFAHYVTLFSPNQPVAKP